MDVIAIVPAESCGLHGPGSLPIQGCPQRFATTPSPAWTSGASLTPGAVIATARRFQGRDALAVVMILSRLGVVAAFVGLVLAVSTAKAGRNRAALRRSAMVLVLLGIGLSTLAGVIRIAGGMRWDESKVGTAHRAEARPPASYPSKDGEKQ
jgi:hypothetical protein